MAVSVSPKVKRPGERGSCGITVTHTGPQRRIVIGYRLSFLLRGREIAGSGAQTGWITISPGENVKVTRRFNYSMPSADQLRRWATGHGLQITEDFLVRGRVWVTEEHLGKVFDETYQYPYRIPADLTLPETWDLVPLAIDGRSYGEAAKSPVVKKPGQSGTARVRVVHTGPGKSCKLYCSFSSYIWSPARRQWITAFGFSGEKDFSVPAGVNIHVDVDVPWKVPSYGEFERFVRTYGLWGYGEVPFRMHLHLYVHGREVRREYYPDVVLKVALTAYPWETWKVTPVFGDTGLVEAEWE